MLWSCLKGNFQILTLHGWTLDVRLDLTLILVHWYFLISDLHNLIKLTLNGLQIASNFSDACVCSTLDVLREAKNKSVAYLVLFQL